MIHSLNFGQNNSSKYYNFVQKCCDKEKNYFVVNNITKYQLLVKIKHFKHKLMKKHIKMNKQKVTLSLAAIKMINTNCKTY